MAAFRTSTRSVSLVICCNADSNSIRPWFFRHNHIRDYRGKLPNKAVYTTQLLDFTKHKHFEDHSGKLTRLSSLFTVYSSKSNLSSTVDTASLYFDGGSRGNPGPGGSGCYLEDVSGNRIWEGHFYLGTVTNNQAEYTGLIQGLSAAKEAKIKNLTVYGDSNLVIKQMQGQWKVKAANMRPLHSKARIISDDFESVKYVYIKRDANIWADELANRAMDYESDDSSWSR